MIALVTTLHETRSAVVIDVSATGVRLRGKNLPPKYADLFIHIEGVVTFGSVQWEDGDHRGIFFDAPLAPSDEAFLRKKASEAQGQPPEIKAALDEWSYGGVR